MSDTNIHNESVYYNKYMKYKNKYNKLKQLQGGNINLKLIYCGSYGCAYKLTIQDKSYVLKGVKPNELTMDDKRYKSFVNELLKGIEIITLCEKEENKEMIKYFCIPVYFPIDFTKISLFKSVTSEQFKQKIYDFYNAIIILIESKLLLQIDNYTTNVFPNIHKIKSKMKSIQKVKINKLLWYITEYGGDDLFTYCDNNNIFNNNNIETYEKVLTQIYEAMNFLHKNNIYHLDLRPENICYNGVNIKIIDFGLSQNVVELDKLIKNNNNLCTIEGIISSKYIPPEIYLCLALNNKVILNIDDTVMFKDFYYMKNTNKIIKNIDNKYIVTNEGLPYSLKNSIYEFDNMIKYYNTYKLKWADYIGIGIGFLDFFTYYAFNNTNEIIIEIKTRFNKLYNMLLSWCIVDYTKRSDKFNDDIKFKLEYDNKTEYKYEGVIKPTKEYYNTNKGELNYYEFIYNQLDTLDSKK